jgi:nicotinamide-nucleotide amidase
MVEHTAPLRAEIIMIGTELLIGQIQDTNATYMAQTLAAHGIHLYQKTTVGDNVERICAALDAALSRCEVVLCSGGLGPTEDDITRECVARVLGRGLTYREDLFAVIEARFAAFRRTATENNKRQATLPDGAEAIDNPHGTAPGVWVEDPRGTIVCMPGVPSELKPMLEERVLPRLRERFGLAGVLHYQNLKVCGVGESRIDSLIGDLITGGANPTVGLLASPDVVRIRIAAHAENVEAARLLIAPVEQQIRERLGALVMGAGDDTLESVVNGLLAQRGWTLATFETQTGGMLAQRLTRAGATQFVGGQVWPMRTASAGAEAIDEANGILLSYASACAIGLLGNPEHGMTWAALLTPEAQVVKEIGFSGAAEVNQVRTAVIALEAFRRLLIEGERA